ncbi:MAG TPA: C13 family peptidase [Terriglobia bacterium]|nr:C13 family peptidase [Terriglobia bacterium]
MLAGLWRATLVSFLAGLIGCTGAGDQPAPSAAADPLPVPQRWSVFLVAGDNAAPVFDNAIARFDSLLRGPAFAPVHLFSADEAAGSELATSDNLSAALAQLPTGRDDGCLVFITSHGGRDGVAMKADFDHDQRLTPARLGTLLDDSCGSRSTVAIVSACFSGIFLDLAAPNRIILTAARADRTSFGCGAEFTYTYYDSCLLDQWPHAPNFQLLYDAVVGCVREKERKLGITPSEPQAAFGAQVANLPLPH